MNGSTNDDQIKGGSQDDELRGNDGDDTLDAQDGSGGDLVEGMQGTDTCPADPGDTLTGCEA